MMAVGVGRDGPLDCLSIWGQLPLPRPVPPPRRPKLAQHFLTDSRLGRRIAESLDLNSVDLVVEIGAGRGAMTELLADRARYLVAIELDAVLAESLKERLQGDPRIEILQADILLTDLAQLCRRHEMERCFVFGNLPYYITSLILHHLFRFQSWIRAMALLMQREVAQRVTAVPGTRAYGYLSVLAQLYSQPHIALSVPPGAFSPSPKVQSALVYFKMRAKFPEWGGGGEGSALLRPSSVEEESKFLEFVKRCFARKRKNLLNNLAKIRPRRRLEQALSDLALPLSVRAEQLTLEQFISLFRRLD